MVIVLDQFTGSHFPYLLEYFPQIKKQFDGFTHFPNALSSANSTEFAMPSIIGGEYYTIVNQNKRRDNHHLAELNAYYKTATAFTKAGYDVGFLSYPHAASDTMRRTPNVFWLDDKRELLQYFMQEQELMDYKNPYLYDIPRFLGFGLFKFMPDGWMRRFVYKDGVWFFDGNRFNWVAIAPSIASFYGFTQIKNTNAKKPTFKFIHTEITHGPYAIYAGGGKCNYMQDGTVWDKPELFTPRNLPNYKEPPQFALYQHFDSEACSFFLLNDLLEWMKKEDIYDNTQIFILSDHSGPDPAYTIPYLLPQDAPNGQDTIFLFKDFNQRGELKSDNRLVSNYDAVTIFCDNLKDGCPHVPPNILKNYPENREIIHARVAGIEHADTQWNIYRAYKIKAPIDDINSYTDVSSEYATAGEFAKK